MGDVVSDITGRTARREARKSRREQEQQIAEARLREQQELSEQEDEIARRRAMTRAGGRQSLIRTSQTPGVGATRRENLG